MRFLSLFAGIGGFDLGLERAGMECAGQVEIDKFCLRVLKHHWPDVKRVEDIRNVTGLEFGTVGLVCGGFPCQPFSCAGKRKGKADDRYLWPEMLRVIQVYRPAWVLGENVAGIIGVELDKVLSDLEGIGYKTAPPFIIPACAVDAPHRRDRVWIVAWNNDSFTIREPQSFGAVGGKSERENPVAGRICATLANSERFGNGGARRLQERGKIERTLEKASSQIERSSENVPDANSPRFGERRRTESVQSEFGAAEHAGQDAADTKSIGLQGECITRWNGESSSERTFPEPAGSDSGICARRWLTEPDVGRVAHGVPGRVDRLRSLGNAVVPQVIEEIGRAIMKVEFLYQQQMKGPVS